MDVKSPATVEVLKPVTGKVIHPAAVNPATVKVIDPPLGKL
jgi:hypothetical protein